MKLTDPIPDALVLLGVAAVLYGCWLIYPPLAWIVGGALLVTIGVWIHRKWERR